MMDKGIHGSFAAAVKLQSSTVGGVAVKSHSGSSASGLIHGNVGGTGSEAAKDLREKFDDEVTSWIDEGIWCLFRKGRKSAL